MGVLFLQYIPKNKYLQLMHLLFFAFGLLFYEFILTKYHLLVHGQHYSFVVSVFINIIIMGSLLWLKQLVCRPSEMR
jgi:hypothetical protein